MKIKFSFERDLQKADLLRWCVLWRSAYVFFYYHYYYYIFYEVYIFSYICRPVFRFRVCKEQVSIFTCITGESLAPSCGRQRVSIFRFRLLSFRRDDERDLECTYITVIMICVAALLLFTLCRPLRQKYSTHTHTHQHTVNTKLNYPYNLPSRFVYFYLQTWTSESPTDGEPRKAPNEMYLILNFPYYSLPSLLTPPPISPTFFLSLPPFHCCQKSNSHNKKTKECSWRFVFFLFIPRKSILKFSLTVDSSFLCQLCARSGRCGMGLF